VKFSRLFSQDQDQDIVFFCHRGASTLMVDYITGSLYETEKTDGRTRHVMRLIRTPHDKTVSVYVLTCSRTAGLSQRRPNLFKDDGDQFLFRNSLINSFTPQLFSWCKTLITTLSSLLKTIVYYCLRNSGVSIVLTCSRTAGRQWCNGVSRTTYIIAVWLLWTKKLKNWHILRDGVFFYRSLWRTRQKPENNGFFTRHSCTGRYCWGAY